MAKSGLEQAASLLRDFEFVDPTWEGVAWLTCWGAELEIAIEPDEDAITPRQIRILRAILKYPDDWRPAFESALFAYYQAEVVGSYCRYDQNGQRIPRSGPRKLSKPKQVWKLIDDPVVCIPAYFHSPSGIEFSLNFNCAWDEEHGLGVLYQRWQPVEFGSWNL